MLRKPPSASVLEAEKPSFYTRELAKEICDAIASSNKGVGKLCNENESFLILDTIYRWISANKDFSEQYAHAKRLQIEVIIDEVIEIADETSQDSAINDAAPFF